jgi:maltose alpha-D-glucosyltransferase/alpha-amylase
VRKAVARVMRFWLDKGVDGMRLDAVPYLIEREGTTCANLPETHDVLRELRRELDARYSQRMLLAEANLWPSDVVAYFGESDECHMAFHFPLMPRLFMALRQEDRHPISEILYQTPDIPSACQWAIFLRNHDELTLEMVTDEERDYMYQTYAADPQMRVNAGIRRRLAPLMENSRRRIELMHGLLLSLPGTPVIYYGDEIGMGDNVYLGDRNGVRTPMQWTADRNGGFSRADPARLYAPLIMDSVYGYQSVNVEAQERSPFSLLNWFRRFIGLRKQHQTFGRGTTELLRPDNRHIFAFLRRLGSEDPILVVANLARTMQPATLDLSKYAGLVPVEMSGGTELPRIGDSPYFVTLGPYAFYWLLLKRQPAAPITARPPTATGDGEPEALPLLLGPDWPRTLSGGTRQLLERDYLAPFLRRQSWFQRAGDIAGVRFVDWGLVRDGEEPRFITILDVALAGGQVHRYVVPLTILSGERADEMARDRPDVIVAPVAGARRGVMHGAVDAAIAEALFSSVSGGTAIPLRAGQLRSVREPVFASVRGAATGSELAPATPVTDRANSTVRLGERFLLKLLRRVEPGPHPEVEIERFLSEDMHFSRVPRLAGYVEYHSTPGMLTPAAAPTPATTVALLNSFVPHQMDGWRQALGDQQRYLEAAVGWRAEDAALTSPIDPWTVPIPDKARTTVGLYLESAAMIGRRTADMHLLLASDAAADRFGTATLDDATRDRLVAELDASANATLSRLFTLVEDPRESVGPLARHVVEARDALMARIHTLIKALPPGLPLTRIHGAYHLEQVLLSEADYVIIDFEGDADRPIDERRRLASPFRDVAGMVRSFHYAAGVGLMTRAERVPVDRERLVTWARWWQTWVTASFLQAYRAGSAGAAFMPADTSQAAALLDLFLLRQILTEARHEATHRADYLWIPLLGLIEILDNASP